MHLLLPALAHDRATEHAREAQRQRLAGSLPRRRRVDPVGIARRATARGLVRLSRASAAAVRRIDACIAEELDGPLVGLDGI